ncbi:preprotein translocase subunit SecA [Fimbriimonas ginsengisoli]|uniref:Protein translocase subunit SecA n=1 Tax=Fimbriimonas ginsengisoli Gsoil 348 TaxID=661478 RepID=A0A068NKN9_FIMGI|nr:preprotein translocase subunit SecA [Fimbriimonas ginsengisoli]AIE84133.1 preprotein translocase subunit SecA [Fimbriimonas ginsengisoli Gsoil 348]
MNFLRKLFDTSKKDVDLLQPILKKINDLETEIQALNDDQLKAKGVEFRRRAQSGEATEKMLPEVFAVVREVSKRLLGMRHFDVQMLGGMVLDQGRIAEMKTGEGKTLVAVAPLILNAYSGRGAHLVTVNDYLARRDAVWMGPVYHFLGLSVGIIQGQSQDSDELGGSYVYTPGAFHADPRYLNLTECSRRDAYGCDITYGTNHEFGFDYLRDNMAFAEEDLVMRELHFAIVDEVDSILIDEARTPHIISGASSEDVSVYAEIDKVVKNLQKEIHYTADKKNHSASMTEEGMDYVEELLGIDNIAADPRLFHHVNASVKAYALFDRDIDYMVQKGEVVIIDENTGRPMYGRRYGDGLHQALEAKEGVEVQRESQTIATITFQNLFRLYLKLAGMTGTAKTEEDEFRKIYGLDVVTVPTHRPTQRTDQPDVIYKTIEAKFRGIGWEILRLNTKQQPVLVGTRSVEMSERVSARLTADMLQRLVISQRLKEKLEVKKDVKGEVAQDAKRLYETDLQDLNRQQVSAFLSKVDLSADIFKGDWLDWCLDQWDLKGDENRQHLEDALKHGIPHNVLNAKYHEREALIVAEAGRLGQVTIATNMAGRGVDILLGGRVEDELVKQARGQADGPQEEGGEYANTFTSYRRGGKERAAPPLPISDQERREKAEVVRALGGLYILGTERHESRRIDNQLRGRAGRQGDPGESKFFVALEDQLWKIFNANMLENPALKMWPPMEEVTAGFLSRMIQKTQERIENHFFEARKHVLEYDDVLNAQREHIYGLRREILLGKDVNVELREYIKETVAEMVANAWMEEEDGERVYDHSVLYSDLNEVFPLLDYASLADLEKFPPSQELVDFVQSKAMEAYDAKAREAGETMADIEKWVMLKAVNDHWMEHLQTVDYIREGIGLRGYGQVDPLVAYKKETYDTFQRTLQAIRDQAARTLYLVRVQRRQDFEAMVDAESEMPLLANLDEYDSNNLPSEELESRGSPLQSTVYTSIQGSAQRNTGEIDWTRVGRNEPCPCGSGKKFKECHYKSLREQGVI